MWQAYNEKEACQEDSVMCHMCIYMGDVQHHIDIVRLVVAVSEISSDITVVASAFGCGGGISDCAFFCSCCIGRGCLFL